MTTATKRQGQGRRGRLEPNQWRSAGCAGELRIGAHGEVTLVCEMVGPHSTCQAYHGGKVWKWTP